VISWGSRADGLTADSGAATVGRCFWAAQRQEDVVVIFRTHHWIAGVLGLCLAQANLGFAADPVLPEPPRLGIAVAQPLPSAAVSPNQKLADAIAYQLRQSGQLRHYTVDVAIRDGNAELSGTVADQPQREEVLRIVRGVPGVEKVVDRLILPGTIQRVQADTKAPDPSKLPPPILQPPPPAIRTGPVEPMPLFMAPPASPNDLNAPRMPPYAWPTYAPYNNYSRVAYPEAYPYNAFPFIGPCYPFPKVPLGWRSVKLEWDDGHWWYSRTASKYDWWKLRTW
jgi:BON domain